MNKRKYHIIIPFLAPSLILYITFVLFPYARAMYISLTKWRGLTPNPEFVGLANFEQMLNDRFFWNALGHNVGYLLVLPIVTISIALYLAFLLTQGKVRFSRFYRITYFFPQVMSLVALGVLWSFIYHPTIGILNGILGLFGTEARIAWLGNPDVALGAIGVVVIWQAVGFYMVLFIAGMESIPTTFYEAARIDGANQWQVFWKITMPLLWDTTRTALVFLAIGATDMFAITQTMTEGGPNRSTDVLATYLYERAFLSSQFGYATAIGVSLFFMVLILSVFTLRVTQRESLEY
ncbi:MAG: sugar ABC transporter permease [Anaerolineae bacterium]|nr:sugar ABC transporter permease [Anaerolineae bacterium]